MLLNEHRNGDVCVTMARLRHSGGVPSHFPRHRFLSFGDRWKTKDHPGVHHGQPKVGHLTDVDIDVRVFPVGHHDPWFDSRNVPLWSAVSRVDSGRLCIRYASNGTFDNTVDLSAEACQRQRRK
jgi:hypothetical protein